MAGKYIPTRMAAIAGERAARTASRTGATITMATPDDSEVKSRK